MTRPKLTNRRKSPNRPSTTAGAAVLGLAVIIMVAIAGAVFWFNPKDTTDSTSQITTKPKTETTGSSGVH